MTPPNVLEQLLLSLMVLSPPAPQEPACTGVHQCTPCTIATVCAPAPMAPQGLLPTSTQPRAHSTACTRLAQRLHSFEQLQAEGGNERKLERLRKQGRAVQEHAQRMGCMP